MISFNNLGRYGRLGNQMFQYAVLLTAANRKDYDFCIPASSCKNVWTEHQLFEAFDLASLHVIGTQRNVPQLKEASFAFDPGLAYECPDNVDLFGFFQSEKYFLDQHELIRKEFSFRQDVRHHCDSVIKNIGKSIVSLHVRRTDFLNQSDAHPPCEPDYYIRAIESFPLDLPVLVLSDDIAWCKSQPIFSGPRFFFSEGNSNIVDMCLMSMCDHHVIANSSFSWWGAWLGENPAKIVIAPSRWFGSGYTSAHDTRDLLPPAWRRL